MAREGLALPALPCFHRGVSNRSSAKYQRQFSATSNPFPETSITYAELQNKIGGHAYARHEGSSRQLVLPLDFEAFALESLATVLGFPLFPLLPSRPIDAKRAFHISTIHNHPRQSPDCEVVSRLVLISTERLMLVVALPCLLSED